MPHAEPLPEPAFPLPRAKSHSVTCSTNAGVVRGVASATVSSYRHHPPHSSPGLNRISLIPSYPWYVTLLFVFIFCSGCMHRGHPSSFTLDFVAEGRITKTPAFNFAPMSISSLHEVNRYHVDSAVGDEEVRHFTAGVTVPGCRGSWKTIEYLPGENGDDVQLQSLEGSDCPELLRAVKRLRRRTYPETDQTIMIERSLLCMSRANVSTRFQGCDPSSHRTDVESPPHQFRLFGCCAGITMLITSTLPWNTVILETSRVGSSAMDYSENRGLARSSSSS